MTTGGRRKRSGQLLYVNETKLPLSVVLIPIIEMQIESSSPRPVAGLRSYGSVAGSLSVIISWRWIGTCKTDGNICIDI